MAGSNESAFARLPRPAAALYDWLLRVRPVELQTREIAADLVSRLESGRVLDIGTGPGRLLRELHRLNPKLQLFGLDISAAMIARATKNLRGLPVDLRHGNIRHTAYEDGFFDAITCVGSFYLWDQPAEGVDEIFRILRAGRSAFLFESYADCDLQAFQQALAANLLQVDPLRRQLARSALNRQLRMTYKIEEFARIFDRTRFVGAYELEKVTLAGLPIWLRIRLHKNAAD